MSSVDSVPNQLKQNGFTIMNKNSNIIHITDRRNCSIVDTELFKRCESEEQLLDAPGDIGMSFMLKTSTFYSNFLINIYTSYIIYIFNHFSYHYRF